MKSFLTPIVIITVLGFCAGAALAAFTVVADGKPVAIIAHLGQPGCDQAALELQHYIRKMSGAELPIERMQPYELENAYYEGKQLLVLAVGEQTAWQFGLDVPVLRPEGFYQMCDGTGLLGVLGKDPEGLMYGVYDLLEQFGVRWYLPTELGENVPKRDTIKVDYLNNVENPDFILRNMWLVFGDRPTQERQDYALWRRRNKMGGVHAETGHNLGRIISPAEYGATHPEYFPLINGQRVIPTGSLDWQPCTSNPEVVRIAAEKARQAFDNDPELWSFSLSPNDGWTGWCECDACVALDPPEFQGDPRHGKGRRMLVFANAVAGLLQQTHPDRHVCFYAYTAALEPPTDMRAHPQVVVAVAHYKPVADHLRPITDPDSAPNAAFIPIVEGWAQVSDKLIAREYFTSLVSEMDGLARVAAAWALAEDIPWYRAHHVLGISSEAIPIWGTCGLNFYLAAKLMWDADADVEAILDDYFAGMYGPAAEPMRRYFETIRDIARERHLKSELFTDRDFPPLRTLLEEALERAETDKQRARVQLSIDHFDYVQLVRALYLTASEESLVALNEFVAAHPDTLAFDQTMHRHAFNTLRASPIPSDLRYTGPPVVPVSDKPVPEEALQAAPAVRYTSIYLIAPVAGESFSVTVRPRRMGRYLDPTSVSLRTPDGEEVARANVGVTVEKTIEIPAAEYPWYVLLVNAGTNAARITCTARAFVLATDRPHFVGPTPRMYFMPRPGATSIELQLHTATPVETARLTAWDPAGAQVGMVQTGEENTVSLSIDLADHPAGAWSFKVDKIPDGYIEDAQVTLYGVLPWLATASARLVQAVEQ